MILELDLGNTYCKWRTLGADNNVLARGLDDRQRWLEGIFPSLWSGAVERVRIASVLGDEIERNLNAQLQTQLNCPVHWVRSQRSCGGVHNAYAKPERLGVDRWLAMIAAWQRAQRSVLVCDIGSALTIDWVDAGGRHRGGYIIPGPRLMAESLRLSTDRVRFDDDQALRSDLDPGMDTGACVGNGLAVAVTGAVLVAYRRAEAQGVGPTALYLTGGYRDALAQNLRALGVDDLHLEMELVLDGLRIAAP